MIFFFTLIVCHRLGFRYRLSSTQSFTAASNNFELAIAVAVATFGPNSDQALASTVGPFIEVPVLLALVYIVRWMANRWQWKEWFKVEFADTTSCSYDHKWPINVAFRASLKKPGRASGEGYIELHGVEVLWWLADRGSSSLVRGRTCGDISPSAAAGSSRRAITCGLCAGNGRGAGITVGEGWLTAWIGRMTPPLLRASSSYGSKSASRSCIPPFPVPSLHISSSSSLSFLGGAWPLRRNSTRAVVSTKNFDEAGKTWSSCMRNSWSPAVVKVLKLAQ